MAPAPVPREHIWFTPTQIAAILDGHQHGDHYRATCPAHGGDNPTSLSIREDRDKYGNPCTRLHCFAHGCSREEICAAMGIPVRCLFAIHPAYAKETRNHPRAKSQRIDRLKAMEEPSPDEIAQIMLEEMIVSDPEWIQTCEPARQKMWRLAQASPKAQEAFTRALTLARLNAMQFWDTLASAMKD